MVETKGTAYGFFHCEVPGKEAIEREIPALKKAGKIEGLEVAVFNNFDEIEEEVRRKVIESGETYYYDEDPTDPTGIESIFEMADDAGLDYVISGTLPGRTNFETARQVSHLLIQMSQSYLNKLGEVWGNVVYMDDSGRFVFLE